MALSTKHSDDDSQYVLVAKMDNVRNLANILKAVHFKEVSQMYIKSKTYPYSAPLKFLKIYEKREELCFFWAPPWTRKRYFVLRG